VPPAAPAQAGTVNAHDLGVAEAMLRFCGRVDHAAEPKLKENVKLMVQGASSETLARIRRSEDYRSAQRSVSAFADKIDEHNVKRFCSESPAKPAGPPSRYLPNRFAGRAGIYYKAVWGIDSLTVKLAESGEIVRFSWRVLDPELAKALNEKASEPSLEDPQAGVSLVVPSMENIGKLRQESSPDAGKSYWMVFSNKGRRVKRGDHVNVVIGKFRANGLGVD
jgi:hypothetical protein